MHVRPYQVISTARFWHGALHPRSPPEIACPRLPIERRRATRASYRRAAASCRSAARVGSAATAPSGPKLLVCTPPGRKAASGLGAAAVRAGLPARHLSSARLAGEREEPRDPAPAWSANEGRLGPTLSGRTRRCVNERSEAANEAGGRDQCTASVAPADGAGSRSRGARLRPPRDHPVSILPAARPHQSRPSLSTSVAEHGPGDQSDACHPFGAAKPPR